MALESRWLCPWLLHGLSEGEGRKLNLESLGPCDEPAGFVLG